ncbi:aconitate hydratase AcnA [Paenalcaligenes hominis]|uniref:aconitate hydratase AcnA n=1 Tax=Paenalcaligenes hominis TaxID=643674 RepID=UPI0035243666
MQPQSTYPQLHINGKAYSYAPIHSIEQLHTLPFSLRILLESVVRHGLRTGDTAQAEFDAIRQRQVDAGISFYPARVFGHDILGLVMLLDMVAMREAVHAAGGDASRVRPTVATDVVIDHSLQVDSWANPLAAEINLRREFERNGERFEFLRWCGANFEGVSVIPPGKGIMHQLHLEHLGQVVWHDDKNADTPWLYPDSCVGTDSHTPMVNGIGILAWGVGGIEAEAVMVGLPVSMPLPEVVGIQLKGKLRDGVLPTDLVLAITEKLRELGVVGKFIEFYGEGLDQLSIGDRGMIANMAPEYGATVVFFPTDQHTLDYMHTTGHSAEQIALVEQYNKAQHLWRDANTPDPVFDSTLSIDLDTIAPSLSGPSNPEDRFDLDHAVMEFEHHHQRIAGRPVDLEQIYPVQGEEFDLRDGDVVIAAITSCTNTANPTNMMAAGLVAKKAVEKGLFSKPWVKTSLVPGSQVTADILQKAGLQDALDQLGFNIAGFGCTTCNGGSGPLPPAIAKTIAEHDVVTTAVLSGNRNFDGRIHPSVRANYLASPALVVVYAIAGSMNIDVVRDALGKDEHGNPVYLRDIWPSAAEIAALVGTAYDRELFIHRYSELYDGGPQWDALASAPGATFTWNPDSNYIKKPPYFEGLSREPLPTQDLTHLRPLVILGDSITTDHISPSGAISLGTPAADYLLAHGVAQKDFNNYTTRRANHEIVMRATFANIRLRNKMTPGIEGGITRLMPEGKQMRVFDAAEIYLERQQDLIILAGKNYGCGSSRDSAAKGVALLGVKAVVAESFERIHRTNLVGMGVLPLQFKAGTEIDDLGLDGSEVFDVIGLENDLGVHSEVELRVHRLDGSVLSVPLVARLDTVEDVEYWKHGGILPRVWRSYL